ncbi:hypothetical protein Q428_14805 [Fervidicella metallireducens AeB]|uniref:DUF4304 domain-containing protein n=1 Tax=Fervidicella metallireducens AeB TaxID=1403537 RepID=A0A017RTF8_9CLOT|nr:DUF4304 domain-containing protein [Fervidicella metallireducens]EYE87175.1 hypothetical protein Q428_14805 [Fervidicella metallireducens AeB]
MDEIRMQDYLKQLIKENISPIMKAAGFKKSSNNFYKDLGDIGWCFGVQSSSWNTIDDVEFTFNTAIFVPALYKILIEEKIPMFPKEYQGIYRRSISKLLNEDEKWYRLRTISEYNGLKSIVEMHIQEFILPRLKEITDINALLEGITQSKYDENPICIAILQKMIGKQIESEKILKQLYLQNESLKYRDFVLEISSKINIEIL